MLGLDLHLRGADLDPATWEDAPEVKEFATRSCHAWGAVIQAAWGTSDEDIAAAVAFGVQHFAPEATDRSTGKPMGYEWAAIAASDTWAVTIRQPTGRRTQVCDCRPVSTLPG